MAAQDLGEYIYLANPYKAEPLPVGAVWPPPMPRVYPAGADDWYGPCLEDAQVQDYSGHWEFAGSNRYVRRALRIPYMYYKASPNVGGGRIVVVDHFLIGYEGGGGGN